MRNTGLVVVVLVVLVLGGFLVFGRSKSNPNTTSTKTAQSNEVDCIKKTNVQTVTVTYTDNGFTPTAVSLNACDKLQWINSASSQVQIGVNPHPVHTGDRSITGGEFTLNLDPGQTKSLDISKKGNFGYHNHLNPLQTGVVAVH